MSTRARHWSLSRVRWTQSTPSQPISLRFILILHSHLRLDLLFRFYDQYFVCISTCPIYLILHDIVLIIFGKTTNDEAPRYTLFSALLSLRSKYSLS
jgi:hypothetical protein